MARIVNEKLDQTIQFTSSRFLFQLLNFFCLHSRGSAADEKRKQDARIAQLEEELEEERTQNELLMEKYKRANMQVCGKSCDQLELINAA